MSSKERLEKLGKSSEKLKRDAKHLRQAIDEARVVVLRCELLEDDLALCSLPPDDRTIDLTLEKKPWRVGEHAKPPATFDW